MEIVVVAFLVVVIVVVVVVVPRLVRYACEHTYDTHIARHCRPAVTTCASSASAVHTCVAGRERERERERKGPAVHIRTLCSCRISVPRPAPHNNSNLARCCHGGSHVGRSVREQGPWHTNLHTCQPWAPTLLRVPSTSPVVVRTGRFHILHRSRAPRPRRSRSRSMRYSTPWSALSCTGGGCRGRTPPVHRQARGLRPWLQQQWVHRQRPRLQHRRPRLHR